MYGKYHLYGVRQSLNSIWNQERRFFLKYSNRNYGGKCLLPRQLIIKLKLYLLTINQVPLESIQGKFNLRKVKIVGTSQGNHDNLKNDYACNRSDLVESS